MTDGLKEPADPTPLFVDSGSSLCRQGRTASDASDNPILRLDLLLALTAACAVVGGGGSKNHFPSSARPPAVATSQSTMTPINFLSASFGTHGDVDAWLQGAAKEAGVDATSLDMAKLLDSSDNVIQRSNFCYPVVDPDEEGSPECIYMCGNSLGLQPVKAREYVNEELDRWSKGGVRGHFEGKGRHWAKIDDHVQKPSADVVGALPSEVAIMNGLSANIHLMFVPFYRPTRERHKVIMEAKAFPSDRYIVESQVKFHGYDPATSIVLLTPREGEDTLRDEDIIDQIVQHGTDTALVFMPGVQYYTGQAFDIAAITEAAHRGGCLAGFDLAHAVGNLDLRLHDWGVDFACWCTYKYLNAGPGAIAGCFVHERHATVVDTPRFAGWWGHDEATRFDMTKPFSPEPGARGFQLSNPPILQCVTLIASLEVFAAAGGMTPIRQKGVLLTAYLLILLERTCGSHVTPVTPREPKSRGCQVSIKVDRPVKPLFDQMSEAGIVCDMREPDVIRLAPCPLYNTFEEVFRVASMMRDILSS